MSIYLWPEHCTNKNTDNYLCYITDGKSFVKVTQILADLPILVNTSLK